MKKTDEMELSISLKAIRKQLGFRQEDIATTESKSIQITNKNTLELHKV